MDGDPVTEPTVKRSLSRWVDRDKAKLLLLKRYSQDYAIAAKSNGLEKGTLI